MTLHQRSCFMQWLSTGCRGCILFTMPQDSDSSSCVGCRRGGFACRSALEPCIAQPQPRPEFLTCAVELLHRGHAKCDSLLAHFGLDGNQQKPQIRGGEPQHSDRALSILCGTAFSREVQTLDMILVIDQKLEGLCNRITVGACERCRQRKVKCLRGPTCLRSFERYRRTPTYGGPLRTLLPVKEEGGEQGNHDTEAASREAPCIDVAQHCVRAVMNPV